MRQCLTWARVEEAGRAVFLPPAAGTLAGKVREVGSRLVRAISSTSW